MISLTNSQWLTLLSCCLVALFLSLCLWDGKHKGGGHHSSSPTPKQSAGVREGATVTGQADWPAGVRLTSWWPTTCPGTHPGRLMVDVFNVKCPCLLSDKNTRSFVFSACKNYRKLEMWEYCWTKSLRKILWKSGSITITGWIPKNRET